MFKTAIYSKNILVEWSSKDLKETEEKKFFFPSIGYQTSKNVTHVLCI